MIFLSLGSSIGNAEEIFISAEAFLKTKGVLVLKKSKIMKNPPMGGVAKNEFSNAVWEIALDWHSKETIWHRTFPRFFRAFPQKRKMGTARKLLKTLKQCEAMHGRNLRAKRWSDRPLDIDILMFEGLVLNMDYLKIPHPEIANRDFVLKPWMEIVSEDFDIPGLGKLGELIKKLKKTPSLRGRKA